MRIIFKHLLPNVISTLVTFAPFTIAAAISSITALDFGIWIAASHAKLGELLKQGVSNLRTAPWIVISTVTALVLPSLLSLLLAKPCVRHSIPKNSPLTNKMKKLKYLHIPSLLALSLLFTSCENPKLKPPREDSNQKNQEIAGGGGTIDREFARELAREFGREFAIEFARQMKDSPNLVKFDFEKEGNVTQP